LQYDSDSSRFLLVDQIPQNASVKPRRVLAHIAFALFMLLSQQLGMAHEITHLSPARVSGSAHGKQLPAEMQCGQCLAFAAIGSALHGAPLLFCPLVSVGRATIIPPVATLLLPHVRAFDSRAPPAVA